MDKAEVERAVIQGWYWQNPQTCALMNSAIAKFCAAHHDRISAFASINPAFLKESLETINRARDEGFIGVGEIHDGVQNFVFCSEEFSEICAACAHFALPICVHLTEKSARQYLGKQPTNFTAAYAAARQNPQTKFIFAHLCGGDAVAPDIEIAPNIFFDTAAFQFTNKVSDLTVAAQKYPNRAMFGSDYPLRVYPRKFKAEEMSEGVKESLCAIPREIAEKFFAANFESLCARPQ